MKKLIKFVFLMMLVGVAVTVVVAVVSKKKLEALSDDEIREFLAVKLSGRVGDDQLATIQGAVISGRRRKEPAVEHYTDDSEESGVE